MSESTSAPAAPAPAPAAAPAAPPSTDRGQFISGPPKAEAGISVSDAARLLSKQRRQASGESEPAAQPGEVRKPSANEMAAAAKAAAESPAEAAPKAPAAPAKDQPGASPLERALGVPGAAPEAAAAPDSGPIVEIDGERYSQAQLREAVLKAKDYTKKSQENSERSRHLQAQQEALATVLPYIQPELARLAQIVQNVPVRPDQTLANTDPARYIAERAAYEAAVEEQQRLGSLTALQQQAHNRAMEQQVAAANEQLAKEYPFWSDPQQRLQVQQEIIDWATTKGGFTRDELRGLANPNHLKTMMKAAMYDRLVSGAKTTAPPQRLQAPVRGAPPPPAPSERIEVAQQAFEQRPNVRTGAALLAARRSNGQVR